MKKPSFDIEGEIRNIQRKEGTKNPFFIVDILSSVQVYNDKTEEMVYNVTGFKDVADKITALAVGDYVTASIFATSRKRNDKWYPSYTFESIDVHSNAVPVEQVAEQATEQADGQSEILPF